MNKQFDQTTKLGEVYKNLNGVNLTVEDMDLPVSVYNYLKRIGVNDLQQILLMSIEDLLNAGKSIRFSNPPKKCEYLMFKLEELSNRIF